MSIIDETALKLTDNACQTIVKKIEADPQYFARYEIEHFHEMLGHLPYFEAKIKLIVFNRLNILLNKHLQESNCTSQQVFFKFTIYHHDAIAYLDFPGINSDNCVKMHKFVEDTYDSICCYLNIQPNRTIEKLEEFLEKSNFVLDPKNRNAVEIFQSWVRKRNVRPSKFATYICDRCHYKNKSQDSKALCCAVHPNGPVDEKNCPDFSPKRW